MRRSDRYLPLAALLIAAACAETITSSAASQLLDAAFLTTPLGFDAAASTFSGQSTGTPFMPGDHGGPRGPNGLAGGADFMGGGFGDDFLGGPMGGGRPFEHGGVSTDAGCVFAAATGMVTCAADTHDGITVTRTYVYRTETGTAQARQDSTTNSVITHVVVTGMRTRRDSTTTLVSSVSDRTVTGLSSTSTRRTINGSSVGTESSAGKDSAGAFTVVRVIGDTTSGVVIPITSGKPTYPIAGTVIRQMTATLTYAGKTPTTSSRREVITYDGSATAKLVITQNGTTRTCTIPLPHGRPAC